MAWLVYLNSHRLAFYICLFWAANFVMVSASVSYCIHQLHLRKFEFLQMFYSLVSYYHMFA
jgi:hypothetical protein